MGLAAQGGTFRGAAKSHRTFGVDEMVRKKVSKSTENFWVRRKAFRIIGKSFQGRKNITGGNKLVICKKRSSKSFGEADKNVGREDEVGRQF